MNKRSIPSCGGSKMKNDKWCGGEGANHFIRILVKPVLLNPFNKKIS